jgi:hypothetical protein
VDRVVSGSVPARSGGCRPGELKARIALIAACALAIAGLVGCAGGIRPACENSCQVVGLHAAPSKAFDFGACECLPAENAPVSEAARAAVDVLRALGTADAGTVSR